MRYRYCIETDSVGYLTLAMNLFTGQGYGAPGGLFYYIRPPFYSVLTGLVWLLTGDIEKAGYLVSIICGSLLLIPVYYLAKELFNKRVACISIILIIFYPYLIESSVDVLRDSTFNFLIVSGIYLFWKALKSYRLKPYVMAGILFSLSYLTVLKGILYIPLAVFLHLLTGIRIHRLPIRKVIGFNLVFILVFLAIAIPYLATVYHYTGRWSLGDKDMVFKKIFSPYYELSLTPKIFEYKEKGDAPIGLYRIWLICKNSARRFIKYLNEAYLFKIPVWYPLLLVFLSGAGFFAKEWTLSRLRCQLFLIIMLTPLLTHFFHWVIPRYFLPCITLSFIWAGNGIDEIYQWWIKIKTILKIKRYCFLNRYWAFTGIVIFLVILSFSPRLTQPIREDPYRRYWKEDRDMGLWMRENGITGEKVLSIKPYAAFYSGGKEAFLPDISYEELIGKARKEKIRYLVISERGIDWRVRRERLKFLLDEDNKPEELKLVHIINPKEGYKILLYRISLDLPRR